MQVKASPLDIKDSQVVESQVENSQYDAKNSTFLGPKSGGTVESDESRLLSWNTLFNIIACVVIIIFLYFLQNFLLRHLTKPSSSQSASKSASNNASKSASNSESN